MALPETETVRSRAFYDRIADGYDQVMATPQNQAIRRCFWRQAKALLPAGGRILDFGAGSGLDAEHFAALGHPVVAYDLSEGMIAVLRERCAAQIAEGRIAALAGTLDQVQPRLAELAPFDGVICNFAVLSLVPEPRPVLRLFGRVVRPGGVVLASIQNPLYHGDLRTRAFWRALLRFPRHGALRFPSAEVGHTTRHLPAQIRRAARPEFKPLPPRVPPGGDCRRGFGRFGLFRLVALQRV